MKRIVIALALIIPLLSCTAGNKGVVWIEGTPGEDGLAVHEIIFKGLPGGSRVWFSFIPVGFRVTEDSEAGMHWYMGNSHYVDIPENAGDEVRVKYLSSPLPRRSWAPEGFVLQGDIPEELETEYRFAGHTETVVDPLWWSLVDSLKPADMIPAVKDVSYGEGLIAKPSGVEVRMIPEKKPAGWYILDVSEGGAVIESADEDGAFYARVTFDKLPASLPPLRIEDWPDLPYRGIMLDVARHMIAKDDVLRLIDLLSAYKINYLHLHIVDDEGWRLEIPSIPELTSYGARHALPQEKDGVFSEPDGLVPGPDGAVRPGTMATGFYTEEDYKEIIRHAWDRRIRVIPEIDTPGHSRAAIKSVEVYERRTGDDSFRLSSPGDSSKYYSAQAFTDNVLDVELPGVYKFMELVFDSLIRLHREAGVPLEAIHIGGDEVAEGAWAGRSRLEMKDMFINRIMDIAAERGVLLAGWQEITMGIKPETAARLAPMLFFVNAWSTLPGSDEVPYDMADSGYPVVLSNVGNTYIDLAYSDGFDEIGLTWGGYVDERKTFALQPFNIYQSIRWEGVDTPVDVYMPSSKKALTRPEMIKGVQVQLWSENLRGFGDVTYDIFPKAVGAFERGWNARPCWPDDESFAEDFHRFYTIVSLREMPVWDAAGINYKKR